MPPGTVRFLVMREQSETRFVDLGLEEAPVFDLVVHTQDAVSAELLQLLQITRGSSRASYFLLWDVRHKPIESLPQQILCKVFLQKS